MSGTDEKQKEPAVPTATLTARWKAFWAAFTGEFAKDLAGLWDFRHKHELSWAMAALLSLLSGFSAGAAWVLVMKGFTYHPERWLAPELAFLAAVIAAVSLVAVLVCVPKRDIYLLAKLLFGSIVIFVSVMQCAHPEIHSQNNIFATLVIGLFTGIFSIIDATRDWDRLASNQQDQVR